MAVKYIVSEMTLLVDMGNNYLRVALKKAARRARQASSEEARSLYPETIYIDIETDTGHDLRDYLSDAGHLDIEFYK